MCFLSVTVLLGQSWCLNAHRKIFQANLVHLYVSCPKHFIAIICKASHFLLGKGFLRPQSVCRDNIAARPFQWTELEHTHTESL